MIKLFAILMLVLPAVILIIIARRDEKKGASVHIPAQSDWYK